MSTKQDIPWAQLQQILITRGVISQTGNPYTARAKQCRRGCGRTIIIGLDYTLRIADEQADPDPLSPAGLIAALTLGRATYDFRKVNNEAWGLWYRPTYAAGHNQPGPNQKADILTEHVCWSVLPSQPSVLDLNRKPDLTNPPF